MIVNHNFSIAVQDDFAIEIHGQGKFRLAKGSFLLSDGRGEVFDFQSSKEESITTVFGAGRRFVFTGRHGQQYPDGYREATISWQLNHKD